MNEAANQNSSGHGQASSGSAGATAGTPGKSGSITVTAKAITEIKRIMSSDPTATNSALRVQVVGGGCSGMSYKLGFDSQPAGPGDKTFEYEGIRLLVDQKSLLFLSGTELDFSDGLNGTGFTFSNPNAKRTCGCGSSFSA
jgi:iron-sulfur cluster assembly protein